MSERMKRLLIELINPAIAVGFFGYWMVAEAGRLPTWDLTSAGSGNPPISIAQFSSVEMILHWMLSLFPYACIALSIAFARFRPRLALGFGGVALMLPFVFPDFATSSAWPAVLGLVFAFGSIVAFAPEKLTRALWPVRIVSSLVPGLWVISARKQAGLSWSESLAAWPDALIAIAWATALLAIAYGAGRWVRKARGFEAWMYVARDERNAARKESAALSAREAIARDVHDIMAHSLAVVAAQADGARFQLEADLGQGVDASVPQAVQALKDIAEVSRAALIELRMVLDEAADSGERIQLDSRDFEALVERVEASGLTVTFTQLGEPAELSAAERLALYRMLQESLTNCVKYAPSGTEVICTIDWRDEAVSVLVSSAAIEAQSQPDGRGITGMKERATALGGWLSADFDVESSSFVVTAYIPLSRQVVAA